MPGHNKLILKWLFVLFLVFQGFVTTAQLKADFSASASSGCSPSVIRFTDISSGTPTNWKWDLGNGTISFLRNPSVTYFSPGSFSVKLVISNSTGKDSITKTQFITIHANPSPDFSAPITTGCFPLAVTFKNLSTPGSGVITRWEWDFGDGVNATDSATQHIYKTAGSFNVSLRVTNSLGCIKSITKPKYIQISSGVLANFDVRMSNSCKAPANIKFTNTTTGVGTISYLWDFGDGSGSTLDSPMHVYNTDGNYTVRLIAKNSTGCMDTITRVNAIVLGNTNADFTVPAKVCQGNLVNIINTSKPVVASVSWNFGDGTSSTAVTPLKKYTVPGTYIIKMIVDFGACLDSVSKTIVVLAKPVLAFTADKTTDCKAPFITNFTQNSSGAVTYSWDFGDKSGLSPDKNPTHTYLLPGVYNVKLIATNAAGCSDTLLKPAYIKIQLPVVTIPNLPISNCAPYTVDFTNKVTSSEAVTGYKWDFGDGSTSTAVSPSHTFLQPGLYTISLVVTTAGGCTDTVIVVNGVKIGSKPVALFSASPLNICANLPVSFTDLSTGKADKWNWQFGDGGTSAEQNPTHLYSDTGYFDVTLIVSNNGCADTIKFNRYVQIHPPIANFFLTYDCASPLQRVFTDKSIGADLWQWDFGDNTTSAIASPVHDYQPGRYTAKLTVTNSASGCTFTKPQTFIVIDEKAGFKVSDSVICKGLPVTFQTLGINAANITNYIWKFGDGTTSSSASQSAPHTYKLAGKYSVTLIITDLLGCKDTLVKPLYMQVDGPTTFFNSAIPGTCLNNAVTFNDSSVTDGVHDIRQWIWNYGDNKSEILLAPPFQHTYSTAGIFTVKLKVIDSRGCADSLTKLKALIISQPAANFKPSATISCPFKPITFTNSSVGPGLTYLWDFGDGSTSSLQNPVHQFASDGLFSIGLSIKDQYGCTDSIYKKDYIKIVIPVANFSMSDSVSNCPPLVVNFSNMSVNAAILSWDFGDGTNSVINNPSHFYAVAGVYNVVLKITSAGGCIDQKVRQVLVKGPSGRFKYTHIIGCNPLTTDFKASVKNTSSIIWDFNDGTLVTTPDSILSHQYVNQGIYLPKIILQDTSGCQVPIIGTDTIVVYGVQANFNTLPVVLCDSGAVKFTDNSSSNDLITSYLWNFNDGKTSTQVHPVHSYYTSGLYYTKLVITTQSGCRDSLTIPAQVKVINSPKIAIAGDIGACIPATLQFSGKILVADTSAVAWLWDFGNGNTSILQNPPKQLYPVANNYTIGLGATNSSGCFKGISKTVFAYPIPDVRITADSTVCTGKSIKLLVQGASTYSWTPSNSLSCATCATPVAKPVNTTRYLVKGTSVNGCVAADSVSVSVKFPFNIQVSKAASLCAGRSTMLEVSGGIKYIWSPSAGLNNPLAANPVATPAVTTNYQVIASDNAGCFKDTGYVPITVYPIPTVDAGADKTINVGKTIDLIPIISTDVTSVNWSPTSAIFRNSYPGIAVKPNESLEYTVEVSNRGGCLAHDRVTVNVLCNDANVFLPNTFSPNGDGINDVFYPRGSGVFHIRVLKIFNRWGEVVFEKSNIDANDVTSGWSGIFKGQKLLPDVFVYLMEVVCNNNTTLTFKGNVALVK